MHSPVTSVAKEVDSAQQAKSELVPVEEQANREAVRPRSCTGKPCADGQVQQLNDERGIPALVERNDSAQQAQSELVPVEEQANREVREVNPDDLENVSEQGVRHMPTNRKRRTDSYGDEAV